ncbi:PAAR domain-containing protein [Cupriavidus sp. NPDC089707]
MPGTLIKLGDKTSHGGVVISGSEDDLLDGQPVARLGSAPATWAR